MKVPCDLCDGAGVVKQEGQTYPCPDCAGDGFVEEKQRGTRMAQREMKGFRQDLGEEDGLPEPGAYGKHNGYWYCCPPVYEGDDLPIVGNLSGHQVIEHEDRTITVSPSILITKPGTDDRWHGYLERGIWREV